MRQHVLWLGLAALTVGGCGGKSEANDGGTGTGSSGITMSGGTVTSVSTTASSTGPTSGTGSGSMTGTVTQSSTAATDSSSATSGSGTDTATGTGNDPGNPLDCGGKIYECGDGMDNDGDGKIDLMDPECTGPCDNDESSFQTGIPGDNVDCKQDCFFDGNSGQGDDGCIWDLRCDPANPGADIGCAYTGGNNCNNQPPNQSQDCIDFCTQYVPPGCDCFGCCTVDTPNGPVSIFLNSDPDCALDNLDACQMCTSQADTCGTPCDPDQCELCFGQDMLPPGCDMPTCPAGGDPCQSNSDCPTDYFCYQQCCYPPPPA